MALIQNNVVPVLSYKDIFVEPDAGVRGDHHSICRHQPTDTGLFATTEGARVMEDGHTERWPPGMEFLNPLVEDSGRTDNKHWA